MSRFEWLEFDASTFPQDGTLNGTQTPVDGPSFYRAACRMREAGFFDTAAQLFDRAIGFDDQHYPAWTAMIDSMVRAGHIEDADRRSYEALNNYRQVRLFYASRALALAHRGALEEAYLLSDVSIEGEPSAYAYGIRAELLLIQSKENRSEALGFLEKAMNLADDPWNTCLVGGMILLKAGWPALAAGYFSEALHCNPQAAAGFLYLGDCFKALRLYDQAQFYYQKALEITPKHELALKRQKECVPFIYGLTRVFHRETLRRRWNKEFEKLSKKGPSNGNHY